MRVRTACIVIALFSSLFGSGAPAIAQGSGNVTYPLDLDRIDVKKKGDHWEIKLDGKRNADMDLPAGTVIDGALRWRFKDIEFFTITLEGSSRKFTQRVETKFGGAIHGLFLRLQIVYIKQPKHVKEFIDKHHDDFFPGKGPWVYTYGTKPIDLGTEAEIENQKKEVKAFFKRHVESTIELEKKLRQQVQLAEEKKIYFDGGSFDTKEWQKWLEKEIRDPIRKLQKERLAAENDVLFLNHSRDVEKYLPEVLRIMARRSYELSKDLYKTLGLPPDKADLTPKDIHTNARKFDASTMLDYMRRLNDSQQLGLELGKR